LHILCREKASLLTLLQVYLVVTAARLNWAGLPSGPSVAIVTSWWRHPLCPHSPPVQSDRDPTFIWEFRLEYICSTYLPIKGDVSTSR
jgi:hypothetical protein